MAGDFFRQVVLPYARRSLVAGCPEPWDRFLLRMPEHALALGSLIVDCRAVVGAVNRNLALAGDAPVQPALDLPEPLLRHLLVGFGEQVARRRFHHTNFRPHAQLVGGLAQVIASIPGQARMLALATSEWALLDQSPDGFRIAYVTGETWPIEVGDLVCLRPHEENAGHYCLVRRVSVGEKEQLVLGLQELAADARPVVLWNDGDDDKSRAILLPRLPAYGDQAGIIAWPGVLRAGQEVRCTDREGGLSLSIGPCLEASDRLELFAVEGRPAKIRSGMAPDRDHTESG